MNRKRDADTLRVTALSAVDTIDIGDPASLPPTATPYLSLSLREMARGREEGKTYGGRIRSANESAVARERFVRSRSHCVGRTVDNFRSPKCVCSSQVLYYGYKCDCCDIRIFHLRARIRDLTCCCWPPPPPPPSVSSRRSRRVTSTCCCCCCWSSSSCRVDIIEADMDGFFDDDVEDGDEDDEEVEEALLASEKRQ